MQLVAVVVVCFLCLAQAFPLRVRVGNGVIQKQHKLQQQLNKASPPLPLSGTSRSVVVALTPIFSKGKSHMRTTISAFSTFLMQRPITAAISALWISALCVFCGLKYPKPITEEKHILNSTITVSDLNRTVRRIGRPQLSSALLAVAVTGVSLLWRRVRQMLIVEWSGISLFNMLNVLLKANVVRSVLPVLLTVLGLVGSLWNERRVDEMLKRGDEMLKRGDERLKREDERRNERREDERREDERLNREDERREDERREDERRVEVEKYENSLLFAELAAVKSMLEPFNLKEITAELDENAPADLWVERNEVLEELAALQLTTGKYVLILGEKGAGKSFVTYKFVQNEPGVVYLWLNNGMTSDEIQKKLLEAMDFDVKKHPTETPMPQLLRLLRMGKMELAPVGVVPMVVVELERNADPVTVDSMFRVLKKMSHVCRGILIMSEAFGAMTMTPDSARRMELWVPPFTDAETREYLGKANKFRRAQGMSAFTDAEIEDIITRLGGRPSNLHDLMKSSVPPAQFVEKLIAMEEIKIKNLLELKFRYAPVLRLLLQKGTLSQVELMDMLHQPFEKIATLAMAKYHVLSYNPVSDTAQFYSRATEQAAKKWAEEEAAK
jgi:hypothetical protein